MANQPKFTPFPSQTFFFGLRNFDENELNEKSEENSNEFT